MENGISECGRRKSIIATISIRIAKVVIEKTDVFVELVEKEKITISNRARALFMLSTICTATEELLKDTKFDTEQKINLSVKFRNAVGRHIKEGRCKEILRCTLRFYMSIKYCIGRYKS